MATRTKHPSAAELRQRVLGHFATFRIPLSSEHLDHVLREADRGKLSHLAFLEKLIGEQAVLRRERSIERRIRAARFAERKTLETFDWEFNKKAIDRLQIEELGTADFATRKDNLVFVGKSGVGKSHLIQALGIRVCTARLSVRYVTSAGLISDLNAALADRTLPQAVRRYSRPDLLIIDEFGFDKIERAESPQAATLLYKVIDARYHKNSTALCTNVDFEAWGDYLGDPPLSMALLDRLVENAIIIKINGRSYRAAMARRRASGARKKAAG